MIGQRVNLLLVDDTPENLLALEAVLDNSDYRLVKAISGEEALKKVLVDDFAVILMDVQMPGLNGFETAKLIKSREKSKHIPVVFITAIHQATEHALYGYSLGAIDYIFKPYQAETLRRKIESIVAIHRDRLQLKQQEQLLKERTLELEELVAQRTYELQVSNGNLDRFQLIGEMAAGIAHEIRNPMTTVRGFLQLLKKNPSSDYVDLMIEELDRANGIITEFLTLAKNKTTNRKLENINERIKKLYPLLQAEASLTNKEIILDLKDCPCILLDEKEIRQMILNLVFNGLDAMSPGAKLTIKTYSKHQNVVLEIHDQGTGIPKGVLDKLGTPFFTTKDKGTGLGLAVCYSVAAHHNAKIEIETDHTGTTFFVHFPEQTQIISHALV